MSPFLSILFDLLITFLNYDNEKSIYELFLVSISKCWVNITEYLLKELLVDKEKTKFSTMKHKYLNDSQSFKQLFQNALQFYSIYLSKLTQLSERTKTISLIVQNVSCIFDLNENDDQAALGTQLCQQLIKQFDKYFLVETNQNLKLIISNILNTILALTDSAKQTALNGINF